MIEVLLSIFGVCENRLTKSGSKKLLSSRGRNLPVSSSYYSTQPDGSVRYQAGKEEGRQGEEGNVRVEFWQGVID